MPSENKTWSRCSVNRRRFVVHREHFGSRLVVWIHGRDSASPPRAPDPRSLQPLSGCDRLGEEGGGAGVGPGGFAKRAVRSPRDELLRANDGDGLEKGF